MLHTFSVEIAGVKSRKVSRKGLIDNALAPVCSSLSLSLSHRDLLGQADKLIANWFVRVLLMAEV